MMTLREKEAAEAEAKVKAEAKAKEAARRAPKPVPKPERTGAPLMPKGPLKPRNYAELDAALASTAFGWDTMASVCISGNRDIFSTLRKCPAVQIKTADGSIVTATQSGTVAMRVTTDQGKTIRVPISDVLFHERFASNLLSGERMTKVLGWTFTSDPTSTWVETPGGNRITLSSRGRISVLMGAAPERVYESRGTQQGKARDSGPNSLVQLHRRLCHMSWSGMMELMRCDSVHGLGTFTQQEVRDAKREIMECSACRRGKQARTNFDHRGLVRGNRAAEILHMDTFAVRATGPDGVSRVQYAITIKDTYSHEGWCEVVQTKDAVAETVIAMLKRVETHTEQRIKQVCSDGGSEFVNHTLERWLSDRGIKLRISPPHTQQLNGVAERSIRTFKDAGRTLLYDAHAPQWMWTWAVKHAVWVWNRARVGAATKKTPYEMTTRRKPSLKDRAHVWGSDCWVHQRKEIRAGAMAAKSEPGIYLGHSEGVAGCTVFMLSNGKRVVSRDVKVNDGRFSHMRALVGGEDAISSLLEGSDLATGSERVPERNQSLGEEKEQPDDEKEQLDDFGELDDSVANEPSESDPDEWKVESILQRRVRPGHEPEYKVRWAGFGKDSDTWEPESNVGDCEALDTFLETRAAPTPTAPTAVRRSARLNSGASSDSSAMTSNNDDSFDDQDGRVHMVMSALGSLQLGEETLSPDDQAIVMGAIRAGIATIEDRTPKNLSEALSGKDAKHWREARQREYDSCVRMGVWEEVPPGTLPRGANVLPYKEVFKIKVGEDGGIAQYKSRFTPMGCRQRDNGIDYKETFARTAMYKTERVALSLAARFDSELVQFDVPTAFLNADVEEEVYMRMPIGFGKDGAVVRLLKSLYGLKQAPRNWDRLIHGFITKDMGWKATVSDPSLYFKRSRTGRLMLIYRFVDDMQGQRNAEDAAEFEEYAGMLRERFNIKQIQTATWMLGMRISRDRKARTITLDQELYVTKALERFGLAECKVANTPEVPGAASDSTPGLDKPTDRQRYMEIVGTLMYAAISTRPDIAHAVHYLASNMVAPTSRHMLAAERVLRYLAGTKGVGLVFGSRNGDAVGDSRGRGTQVQVEVCAYADADWANDKIGRKSISGWVAKLNGDPVSWSSKKQRTVATSTCEAELYAQAAGMQEVLWLRGLLGELGLNVGVQSRVYGDNQGTIALSKKGVKSERTKHVDVKYHFVTETVEAGTIGLKWVPSAEQQADIFTKALSAPVFLQLRKNLMTQ